jgi:peroxiredoxin Q/BCP
MFKATTLRTSKAFFALPLLALAPWMLALSSGDSVPDFSAKNQDGTVVKLSEQKGKPVLLFFYPKDETPGCTKQACTLRDEYAAFKKRGAVVYGISRQDAASHQEFRRKHKLPFDLLVDSDGSIAEKLGVGTMPLIGLHKRQSLLIGADGKLIKFYPDVDPASHASEVLKDLEEAAKPAS